jgi:hypothetical protein
MIPKLNKKDILISSVIMLLVLVLITLIFPFRTENECIEGEGFGDCMRTLTEPLQYYWQIRMLAPILAGMLYYYYQNKPKALELGAAFVVMLILYFVYYMLASVLI